METTNGKVASATGEATERAEADRFFGTDYAHSPTKSIDVDGTPFVYRRLGLDIGVPVVFLHHWGAALDEWDPRRTLRRQLTAIKAWGKQAPWDLTSVTHPVLVANGDQDAMVPTSNSRDLAQRLPNARLKLYPDAGHGGVFQYHEDFVREAVAFLG